MKHTTKLALLLMIIATGMVVGCGSGEGAGNGSAKTDNSEGVKENMEKSKKEAANQQGEAFQAFKQSFPVLNLPFTAGGEDFNDVNAFPSEPVLEGENAFIQSLSQNTAESAKLIALGSLSPYQDNVYLLYLEKDPEANVIHLATFSPDGNLLNNVKLAYAFINEEWETAVIMGNGCIKKQSSAMTLEEGNDDEMTEVEESHWFKLMPEGQLKALPDAEACS